MTPSDILKADPQEVRICCALLDGWRWTMRRGHDCRFLYNMADNPLGAQEGVLIPAPLDLDRAADADRWVARYTESLDAVRPLESATRSMGGWKTYLLKLSDVVDDNTRAYGPGTGRTVEIVSIGIDGTCEGVVTADALTRARAICLARIEELSSLLEDKS